MSFFGVFVYAILLCLSNVSDAVEDEPVFSKLKYDKEMLETMVRMEARMNQWDKERKIFEENFLSILEHRRVEMHESFSAQNRKIEKIFEDFEEIRDDISNRTAHLEELAESLGNTQHVAFNAYTTYSGSYPVNKTVIFPHVLLNEGDGYNNKTGFFTAPTAGLYHFSVNICHPIAYVMAVSISHRGKEIARSTVYESNGATCSSVSAPTIMNAGEQVSIQSIFDSNRLLSDRYRWPSFSGYLVTK